MRSVFSLRSGFWSSLLGMVEAALFMPGCEGRFSGRLGLAAFSFVFPFMILPLSAATLVYAHPEGALSAVSTQVLIALYVARLALYLALFFGICYATVRLFEQSRMRFLQFVTAHNLLVLPPFFAALPLALGFWNGAYAWADIYPMMVFLSLYGHACLGYAAVRIFRVPFEIGISAGALALVLNQGCLFALKSAAAQALFFFA